MLMQQEQSVQLTQHAMGTVMTHRAFGLHAEESLAAVCSEISRLERLLSCFLPHSEISRINQSAGMGCEKVSHETFEVLTRAAEFSRKNPGFFDVTIAPLVWLWNQSRQTLTVPDEAGIQQVLSLVNDRDLILDAWEMTAGLKNFGQSINLGGIGKGYTAEKILEIFSAFGVSSAYSNLGGNVIALGSKPDGSAWHVGIQHPRLQNGLLGSVAVRDESVVTSGDYQRFFTDRQGVRHHHILNPSTGYPCRSGLISVTIVAEKSLTADVLSTMVFVAGRKKGLEILSGYADAEAVLVDDNLQVYVTKGLKDRFQADNGIRRFNLE